MKIVLPIKRVVDYHVAVQVKADRQGVDIEHAKKSMNPFDAIAVEQAIQLKEQDASIELLAVSIGSEDSTETLRQALAMGVDRALLIRTEDTLEPLNVAKILQQVCTEEKPDLVICGKQAIDDDCNQTGQMLAAMLNWPQATFSSKVTLKDKSMEIVREIDEGLETVEVNLPAVVTCDLRLNEPRYASLPNIMKAKKKPIEQINASDLGIDTKPRIDQIKVEEPPKRKAGIKVANVEELVQKLKNEAKVI